MKKAAKHGSDAAFDLFGDYGVLGQGLADASACAFSEAGGLQNKARVGKADLELCEAGARWSASPAQLPVSTVPHPPELRKRVEGRATHMEESVRETASPVLSPVDPDLSAMWSACDGPHSSCTDRPCVSQTRETVPGQ